MFFSYFKKSLLLFFLLLSVSFVIPEECYAQQARFKITSRRKPPSCHGGGCEFKKGYVQSKVEGILDIVVFIQHKNGYWESKTFTREGPGFIDLNLMSCDYTGNYYAYVCPRENAGNCKFPDTIEVENMHKAKDQTPKFKMTKITKEKCLEGGKKVIFEKGYIHSPSGHQVEVTVFVEKLDGKWRKKHFIYFGTGVIDIDMEGCDLTGKYKSIVQYTQ